MYSQLSCLAAHVFPRSVWPSPVRERTSGGGGGPCSPRSARNPHIRCPVLREGGGFDRRHCEPISASVPAVTPPPPGLPLLPPPAAARSSAVENPHRTFLPFITPDRGARARRERPDQRRPIHGPHDSVQEHVRSMLGRGVKRKWSCLEEELGDLPVVTEDKPHPNVSEAPPPPPDGPVAAPSKSQQRQVVLGLCLEKLQRYQAGVELSLRRSVLLINTLRQIQEDMQSEGEDICDQDVLLNGVHHESCLLRDSMKEDMAVTCPNCIEDDIDSLSMLPELSNQEANSLFDQKTATMNTFSNAVNATGYLSDLALDDIFEDIDTSMYETTDFPSAWASGWPNGMSLWADEDVKMKSNGHNGTIQSCLTDLNELDHIMEILVKS